MIEVKINGSIPQLLKRTYNAAIQHKSELYKANSSAWVKNVFSVPMCLSFLFATLMSAFVSITLAALITFELFTPKFWRCFLCSLMIFILVLVTIFVGMCIYAALQQKRANMQTLELFSRMTDMSWKQYFNNFNKHNDIYADKATQDSFNVVKTFNVLRKAKMILSLSSDTYNDVRITYVSQAGLIGVVSLCDVNWIASFDNKSDQLILDIDDIGDYKIVCQVNLANVQ